ncbi:MAG: hypothetical protein ACI90V_007925, partial [Bacillariaceae sp.]
QKSTPLYFESTPNVKLYSTVALNIFFQPKNIQKATGGWA